MSTTPDPEKVRNFLAEHGGLKGDDLEDALKTLQQESEPAAKFEPPQLPEETQERMTAPDLPTPKPLMGDKAWLDSFPKVLMENCQPTDIEKTRFAQAMLMDEPFDQEVLIMDGKFRIVTRSVPHDVINFTLQWTLDSKPSAILVIDLMQFASVACCLTEIAGKTYELPGKDADKLEARVAELRAMQHVRWAWVLTAARMAFIKQRILADMVTRHLPSFSNPAA